MVQLEESKEMVIFKHIFIRKENVQNSNPERSTASKKEQLQLKKIVQVSEGVAFENTTLVADIVDKVNETMEIRRAKPLCDINTNDSVISVLLDACS